MQTLIVGGGLSGLALAHMLEAKGHDYLLIEARARFGGRIMSEQRGAEQFDMGPTWFWPGQSRIAALIDKFGLEIFDQFADGISTFEDEDGKVGRGRDFASMQGSWRVNGGLAKLTDLLAAGLPDRRKRLNAPLIGLAKNENGITAMLYNGEQLTADHVVLALPPRLAAKISFAPALAGATTRAMEMTATWMAGQAKAIAVYDKPFWREQGLSGDATSRHGPMVEIHDASPAQGGPYALFGFIGIPPEGRANEQLLRQNLLAQLKRLFGADAGKPLALFVKDWAFDAYTSTEADKAPLFTHPSYGLGREMTGLWSSSLHFSGTEVAPQFGGYIEGALEAAENVLKALNV